MNSSDVAEITLMSPGDLLFLYSDGVYDGSNPQDRRSIEEVVLAHKDESARNICHAILEYAVKRDDQLRLDNETDLIDDKTAFIIKRG